MILILQEPLAAQICLLLIGLLGFSLSAPHPVFATEEYARQTGQVCGHCHVDQSGGGSLTDAGRQFLLKKTAEGSYRPLSLARRLVRLMIGYLHILAAIVWFGTIMYVHVLLKPAYASKGLPKGELRLGWLSILVLAVTGTLLTIARIPTWESLVASRFGILLTIKIALFLVMAGSAVVVTAYIGPKLRRQKGSAPLPAKSSYTLDELARFDGKNGIPAYIAYKQSIYDVTGSRLWKNGSHVMKHAAGSDLTDILGTAPHGEDRILAMPRIGALQLGAAAAGPPFHIRLFYFFAYMNLALVFIITFIVALWRWW